MMKIMIINGPNLNMLGIREKSIYGSETYEGLLRYIEKECHGDELTFRQSNHEGDLIDWIQEAYFEKYDGVVINPGGYTHTSVALGDAVKAVSPLPVVEVHISDIAEREDFRHVSYVAPGCIGQIKGQGFRGYVMAVERIREHLKNQG